MFATVPRMRSYRLQQQPPQQQEEKPEGGMGDSNYGVRSLGSEADWGGSSVLGLKPDSKPTPDSESDSYSDVNPDTDPDNDREGRTTELNESVATPPDDSGDLGRAGVNTLSPTEDRTEGLTPTTDPSSLPLPRLLSTSATQPPPSPSSPLGPRNAAHEHDGEHHNQPEPEPEPEAGTGTEIETETAPLSLSHAYLFEERDNLSEPSSPASFASMPTSYSYMSSLSRESSLAGVNRSPDRGGAGGMGIGMGMGMVGSEELVMPLLNVSQSTDSRWTTTTATASTTRNLGQDKGIKIVILGNTVRKEEFIRELKDVKEVIELKQGEYGIIGGDRVIATLSTGLTSEDVESRIEAAYTALDGILHPNPSPGAQGQLQQLVLDYASKSDWIHLLYVLDAESSTVDALAQLVPALSASASTDTITPLLELPPMQASSTVHSHPFAPGPTPRPNDDLEPASYFGSRSQPRSRPGSRSQSQSHDVAHFIHALSYLPEIQQASITKFLTWRPTHLRSEVDMASSQTSQTSQTSHSSGGVEAAPMPTVARAQGGGEWEANLSRRIAKRRQSIPVPNETSARHVGQSGPGKRKSSTSTSHQTQSSNRKKSESTFTSSPSSASCGPLFPPIPSDPFGPGGKRPAGSGVGLGDILEKTFGSLRKKWKWGVVAATALVFVVGWNWVKGV